MFRGRLPLGLIVALLLPACAGAATPLRDGDIIFHTSRSAQSVAIQRATHSPYSHVGLVLYRDGKPHRYGGAGKDARALRVASATR